LRWFSLFERLRTAINIGRHQKIRLLVVCYNAYGTMRLSLCRHTPRLTKSILILSFHSMRSLPCDRSIASSKACSPQSTI
jgi:hypothetical protein